MLVVHAGFLDGDFVLWGEVASASPPAARRGRARSAPVRPHPGDAGAERLTQALKELRPDTTAKQFQAETVAAWLPTVKDRPLPSSPLLASGTEIAGKPTLAAWQVSALRLAPQAALDLLWRCVGDAAVLLPGVVRGVTLTYWVRAARWAAALVSGEQFLPSVRQDDGNWIARWQPVITGPAVRQRNQLAQAMPAACRALTTGSKQPTTAPGDVLNGFLDLVVDTLVRDSSAGTTAAVSRAKPRSGKKSAAQFDSVHDQWLHALRSPDGTLTGSPAELKSLAEQVRGWQRPAAVTAAAPFRLCFRLEEPPANPAAEAVNVPSDPWEVRYLLQAQDDPSLLVPVAEAWQSSRRLAGVFRRYDFEPREFLLTALGQAAAVCSPVEASLRTAEPGGYSTELAGAHAFLTQSAGLLKQAGFEVLLPSWWTGHGTRQQLTARAHARSPKLSTGLGGLSLLEVIQFDWRLALGDQEMSRAELEALARLKVPLVQVRGQWVQVDAEEIRKALDYLKKQSEGSAPLRDLVRMALGGTAGPAGVPVDGVVADGWIGELLGRLDGRSALTETPPHDTFQGTLRPYQQRGLSWLSFLRGVGLGSCLADDMGLGKTIQALALVQRDWHANKRPALLVCPTSVVGNWRKEAERFTPDLPVLVHHGLARGKGPAFVKQAKEQALVLTSYSLLHRDLAALKQVEWAGVLLDEAQNIKNPETKQAQAARALPAGYRVALTGTPVENHVGDLWSILEFLNPGFLGSLGDFRRRFFVPIQALGDRDASQRLKRLTGPFILRRVKTDRSIISDLPDKVEAKVFCTLTREQASLYAATAKQVEDVFKEQDGIRRRGLILGLLTKLKQVCNHPAHFLGDQSALPDRSGKLERATEMLAEMLEGADRALIFTQFTEMGELLQRHLQETLGVEVPFLHGGVPAKQRDRLVERFQQADGPRLFLLSLKAGGTGLNLTAANQVFHFDRWWNPAVENQATDRAFRIGQEKNVLVHKFVCVGTVEEKIDQMIETKKGIAGQVVGSGEEWLTELNNDQLRELFTLRKEAIGG
jgi:superfamily II DNA or RNA helicase